ncbi:MAG: sensor histidine kinase, partial [Steroidobacteraceae bacterium]
ARRARAARIMLFGKLLVDFAELDIALICVWIAVYFGLRPLRRLQEQVETRAPRDLPRFDEGAAPGEVRPLLKAFNRLLELLRDAAESQRRFVADAAHQMRTPVAGLLAQLELLRQQPAAAPLAADLTLINRGVQRLSHSANQLLALARAEPLSSLPEQFRAVSAAPLIKELIERNLSRADAAGLDLGAELHPVDVNGDAALLEDLVSNLIDNAIKYTPRGGRITVRCGALVDGSPFIEVEDDGPGIPEADRVRVRERFYRRPGSASSGCGLGLAIVDEIARAHAATFSIEAGSGTDGEAIGARMRLKFPPL